MDRWIQIGFTVATALAAAGMALLYRGFQTGKWAQSVGEGHEDAIQRINGRLDRAGAQMSDLSDDIQTVAERMRKEFVTREVFEIDRAVSKERRDELQAAIQREHDKLWQAIRGRRS